jgi:tetratricopeptide (TPR) repeat protein
MKKIKIILFFALSVSYFSCNDATDIVQDGEFNESATFQSVDDMDRFLSSVYANLSLKSQIAFTTIFTDEVGIGSANAGQNLDLYKFFLTNNDNYADAIWLNNYTVINYANRVLRGSTRFTPSAADLPRYNSILAEARALRAWGHFQLLCYYSADMKDDSSLGVILMDRVPSLEEDLPRNTTGEVFGLIESDLQYAQDNLINPTDAQAYFYVTKTFIDAFRARMYAYRGNYPQALTYAQKVIDESGLTLTPAGFINTTTAAATSPLNYNAFSGQATTNSPYRKLFADGIQGETIFGLSRVQGNGTIADIWFTNSTQLGGSPLHDMGRNLYNMLWDQNNDGVIAAPNTPVNQIQPDDHDIRSRAFIDRTAIVAVNPATVGNYKNGDVLCIDKYPGKPTGSGVALLNDHKVIRLSEMYLIKAEALAASGNLNGASNSVASVLKQIRDVRTFEIRNNTGVVIQPALPSALANYGNATDAWADILKERRKELCFEGHRYVDLRRLGGLANVSIDRYYRDCDENNVPVCTLPLTDHRFVLPIPIAEIIANNNIQQNPEY